MTTELLLERDRELDSLGSALNEAAGGTGRLVLIEGPAGIGKTRLLAELRAAAEQDGARVLSARGSQLEREFPFGVVRQLFEPPLADPDAREGWLAGAAAPARTIFELRRARRPTDAREPLRRALELAEMSGARGLEEHVRSELYATGARPRTTALDGLESLTERELRVATLGRGGTDEPRYRPDALRDAENRRGAPLERLPEVEHELPA